MKNKIFEVNLQLFNSEDDNDPINCMTVDTIFYDNYGDAVEAGMKYTTIDIDDLLEEGVRRAQIICYSSDFRHEYSYDYIVNGEFTYHDENFEDYFPL